MSRWQQRQYLAKRVMDQLAATGAIAVLAPLLVVLALLIRVDSPGPALFTQARIGLRGKRFRLYKLRTMVADADRMLDAEGRPTGNRVTRVGRWLRRSSLDELPQLLNIALGQMAVVGPRPLLPDDIDRCRDAPNRHDVLPGVTGLAQVNGRNTLPWSERIAYDVEYIRRYSLWLDVRVLAATTGVVLLGRGVVLDRNSQAVDDLSSVGHGQAPATAAAPSGVNRTDTPLSARFSKDPVDERFLDSLNRQLVAGHERELKDLPEEHPTLHVIGAPRSGTTLATQIFASALDVGYINNLVAAFWRAPVYGMRLSQKLMPEVVPETFQSQFGRTTGLAEPHEFGYFWAEVLKDREMAEPTAGTPSMDSDHFRRMLTNLADAAGGRPILLKSFLLAWRIDEVRRVMPRSLFLWIRRDPVETALSILRARVTLTGDEETWIGMKPREHAWLRNESPAVQAAGQVWFVEKAIQRQVHLAPGAVLPISLVDLTTEPSAVIDRVVDAASRSGSHLARRGEPPQPLRRPAPSVNSTARAEVQDAFARFVEAESKNTAA